MQTTGLRELSSRLPLDGQSINQVDSALQLPGSEESQILPGAQIRIPPSDRTSVVKRT